MWCTYTKCHPHDSVKSDFLKIINISLKLIVIAKEKKKKAISSQFQGFLVFYILYITKLPNGWPVPSKIIYSKPNFSH